MPKKRVLVVDDAAAFRDVFEFILEPLGFEVDTAEDGVEGLERVEARGYDLVFSDIHMPKMSGLGLLRSVRRLRPEQPVVMMSSGSSPRDALEESVMELGAASCLHKPFTIAQLLGAVEETLHVKLER